MVRHLANDLIDRFVAEELARQCELQSAARFLDIGCGDLRYRRYTEFAGWYRVFGDFAPRAAGISIQFDAHQLPFQTDCFDVVLMTEVLEHLSEPRQALADIARVVRKGGTFVFTVPFLWGLHEVPYDFFRYTEFGLSKMLSEAGFQIVYFQRRANLVGVVMVYFGMIVGGIVEAIRRIGWLAPVGWLLGRIVDGISSVLIWLYLLAFYRSISVRHRSVGEGLDGLVGSLARQHLGYNVVCEKI